MDIEGFKLVDGPWEGCELGEVDGETKSDGLEEGRKDGAGVGGPAAGSIE